MEIWLLIVSYLTTNQKPFLVQIFIYKNRMVKNPKKLVLHLSNLSKKIVEKKFAFDLYLGDYVVKLKFNQNNKDIDNFVTIKCKPQKLIDWYTVVYYKKGNKGKKRFSLVWLYGISIISHCTNTLGKGMNPIILPPAMGK